MKYSDKLKDPRWQKKRLEIFQRDEFRCVRCFDEENTLSIHHCAYEKGKEPWEYNNDDLLTLCQNCHDIEYSERPSIEKGLLHALRKKKFMADDVQRISIAFHEMTLPHVPEVSATLIAWILQNESMMRFLCDEFFKSINSDRKKETGGDGK